MAKVLPGYPNRRGTDAEGTISASFEILKINIGPFILYILIPTIILFAIQIATLMQTSRIIEGMGGSPDFTDFYENMITLYSILIPATFFRTAVQMFFIGGIVKMAQEGFKGKRVSLSHGLSVLKENALMLVGAGILLTFLLNIGFALCCIGALVFCYWWMFTIPIIVLETKGVMDSLKTSKRFATNHGTFGFTLAMIAIVIIFSVLSVVINAITGTSGYSFGAMGGIGQINLLSPYLLMGTFLNTFITSFALLFVSICITVHYIRGGGWREERRFGQQLEMAQEPQEWE